MSDTHSRVVKYQFRFPDGKERLFRVEMETPSLHCSGLAPVERPDWTRLSFKQCPNCPLKATPNAWCPVAVNLCSVVTAFRDCSSHEEVDVCVLTAAREYRKRCPLQMGLSSLIGLIMSTSGCPVLDKLRPMAYTHLPFADSKETTFRAITTYLLSQCIRQRQGRPADWEMQDLAHTYEEVRIVNRAFAERIRSIESKDAGVNAVVILDTFAGLASFAIGKCWWKDIEALFAPMTRREAASKPTEPCKAEEPEEVRQPMPSDVLS